MFRESLPPRMNWALHGAQYLVMTMKGVEFAEEWYNAGHIPPQIARLYLLLLKLIWMKGVMAVSHIQRLGYSSRTVNKAISEGYVEIMEKPIEPLEDVRKRIENMMGEAPGEIYA